MFNYNNYPIPDERQTWRNTYEIKMAALQHEQRRMQMMNENASQALPRAQFTGKRKPGLSSFIMAPLRMLATLFM